MFTKGQRVEVKFFGRVFTGTVMDFGSKGACIKPDHVDPWMFDYFENDEMIFVDYDLIKEI